MATITITLTNEEKQALSNYPTLMAIQYIWVGILAMRGLKTPATLSELNVQYMGDDTYNVVVTEYDYSVNLDDDSIADNMLSGDSPINC